MLVPVMLLACSKGPVENVEAEITDVGTVVRVSFDTKDETTATVLFGPGDLRYETPPTEKGTHHEALLVGLPGLTEAHYQIVVDGEEDEERTIETQFVPNDFPEITMTGGDHDRFAGVSFILDGQSDPTIKAGPALLDPEGRIAWYHLDHHDLQSFRTRLLKDGSGVVYNLANISGAPAENSALVKVPFDGSEETVIPVDFLAHDFVELDDGTLAAIAFEFQPIPAECPGTWKGKGEVIGNKIVEIAPDGTQSVVWTSWDSYDPCECFQDLNGDGVADGYGWTFANAVDYDEATESYLVSFHNFDTIVSLKRSTGDLNWAFGSTCTDFHPPKEARFHWQHQFEWFDDRLLVFDNDGLPFKGEANESRVLEFEFDPVAQTADLIWEYRLGSFTFVLGDVQRLDGGDTMVTASVSGIMERVTPDGTSPWELSLPAGGRLFAFAEHYTSPYEPMSAPD